MAQPKPILKTWLENEASAYKRFHEDLLEEHDRPGQNMLLLKVSDICRALASSRRVCSLSDGT